MKISSRIILDSIGPTGARLTTFEVVLPRILLAELNTHRGLSKSSASSRAIPVEKMLSRVVENPFVPIYWGKNQKGMEAEEELEIELQPMAKEVWLQGRRTAIECAEGLLRLGVHKQIANRVLEPYMFHTAIVTASELGNFFALRVSRHAQPEMKAVAVAMLDAYEASRPQELYANEWHLPYVNGQELLLNPDKSSSSSLRWGIGDRLTRLTEWSRWARVSSARCARVSYLTQDGVRDVDADLALADRLEKNGHMSPFEHAAEAFSTHDWRHVAHAVADMWEQDRIPTGNLWGWRSYRKTLENEHDFSINHPVER